MASPRRKFLFETCFDGAEDAVPGDADAGSPPSRYGEEDVVKARADGMAAGLEAAREDAVVKAGQALIDVSERIADGLERLFDTRAELERQINKDAVDATLAMLGKLFPGLAEARGLDEIEALIGECLTRTVQEPRIVVRLAESQLDTMARRIDSVTAARGYEGKVVLLADENVAIGDAVVEWADGGATRDSTRLLQEIEAAAARASFLSGDAGPPDTTPEDNPAAAPAEDEPAASTPEAPPETISTSEESRHG